MTGFQAFTTGTAALQDLDPYRFPAAVFDGEPERTPSAYGVMEADDLVLPAPDPASRLCAALAPVDRRRLELHAALTTAGVAPLPGDLDAIEALCTLDDTTHAVLRRWINHAM
ncbi:hypothetical protein [Streptomyces roseicoloratus]|uniref:Uncharacterized protein n=1 Tax=Streptomyces roseicoloratus TaxID=2508722 RepID=A0ABY9RRC5_9ACTN|nr:hypothetical protein [Streptomyces roseicoloratus]WMX44026.1 hypothetical protein RGF97_02940 [Streptomyces roseicoloratus]